MVRPGFVDCANIVKSSFSKWAPIPFGLQNSAAAILSNGAQQDIPSNYRDVQGTSVCALFDLTIASTDVNEKTLQKIDYENYV